MRADRMVSILLMLQRRGRITAADVAAELEISERTARRDLEALGLAGLPIVSRQGRNGGWELVGGGRTDLSGLSAAEARALFLVAGPASSATPAVKSALRKLVRALPEPFRNEAEAASAAIVVDMHSWDGAADPRPAPRHLEAVQRAVIDGEQIELGYVARDQASSTRLVHPLGLAAKGTVWYLVADTEAGMRTFRVDRVTSVTPTGRPVERPKDFDLTDAWRMITQRVDDMRTPIHCAALADSGFVDQIRWIFGTRVHIGPSVSDGRVELEIRGHSIRSLAGELGGFGARLEILHPEELRDRLCEVGQELVSQYGGVTQ